MYRIQARTNNSEWFFWGKKYKTIKSLLNALSDFRKYDSNWKYKPVHYYVKEDDDK